MRRALLVVAIASVVLAASASAYDRAPVRVAGLVPDGWGQSTTRAGTQLRSRYPGIVSDYCVGAIMAGYENQSSFVRGLTRYWDKLVCVGSTYSTGKALFVLIFDSKGPESWIIYRLKGVTISALQ